MVDHHRHHQRRKRSWLRTKPSAVLVVLVFVLIAGAGGLDRFFPALPTDAAPTAVHHTDATPVASTARCTPHPDVVVVRVLSRLFPHTATHVQGAIERGAPQTTHLDREGAAQRRTAARAGVAVRSAYVRDAWPMALTREGGSQSDVAYVPEREAVRFDRYVERKLRRLCDGQALRFDVR